MSTSKTQYAYEQIKGKIISGELPPSADVSEDELKSELGMSRTPIREAIMQLQNENFLEIFPRRGIVVTPLTFDLLRDVYEVRLTVEPRLFSRALGKLPDSWLLRVRDKFMNAPVPREDVAEYTRYQEGTDFEFCSFILQIAGNRFFHDSMQQAYDHSRRICALTARSDSRVDADVLEHISIVNSMLSKDGDEVEKVVKAHVENTRKNSISNFLNTTL